MYYVFQGIDDTLEYMTERLPSEFSTKLDSFLKELRDKINEFQDPKKPILLAMGVHGRVDLLPFSNIYQNNITVKISVYAVT